MAFPNLGRFMLIKGDNGAVRLACASSDPTDTSIYEVTMTGDEWIDVVREMSVTGPTALNLIKARQVHFGG